MTDEFPSASAPSFLPHGEKGASRSVQRARHFDRLRWRCRRGMLELDLVLLGFLERQYPHLNPAEQALFESLLDIPDESLLAYVQGSQTPPEKELKEIVEKLRK